MNINSTSNEHSMSFILINKINFGDILFSESLAILHRQNQQHIHENIHQAYTLFTINSIKTLARVADEMHECTRYRSI